MRVKEIFASGGLLARHLSAFEARSGQLQMAQAVAATLAAGAKGEVEGQRAKVLLVEAETVRPVRKCPEKSGRGHRF